jgi:hypothetical protein
MRRTQFSTLLRLYLHATPTPPTDWCHSITCLFLHIKGNPTIIDNYRPIALMKNLLKLWTALFKDAGSAYAEAHGILSDQHDGFRHSRSIHEALASLIMTIEDAKSHNKDLYIMYANFKGTLNGADQRIMFRHMRKLGMPTSFVDTYE